MMTFDKLEPGAALGEHAFALTDDAAAEWVALFPDDAECLPIMPPAMVAMVIMQAFVTLLHDRPQGNIHAGQKFWISRLPLVNDELVTTLKCAGKELRNGRRWVTFASDTSDAGGHLLFSGEMTTIWAQ